MTSSKTKEERFSLSKDQKEENNFYERVVYIYKKNDNDIIWHVFVVGFEKFPLKYVSNFNIFFHPDKDGSQAGNHNVPKKTNKIKLKGCVGTTEFFLIYALKVSYCPSSGRPSVVNFYFRQLLLMN